MTTYIFDGSLEGLLTAIFEFYERKSGTIKLVAAGVIFFLVRVRFATPPDVESRPRRGTPYPVPDSFRSAIGNPSFTMKCKDSRGVAA